MPAIKRISEGERREKRIDGEEGEIGTGLLSTWIRGS